MRFVGGEGVLVEMFREEREEREITYVALKKSLFLASGSEVTAKQGANGEN